MRWSRCLCSLSQLSIVLFWLPTAPQPAPPSEAYLPLPSGASFVYRVTHPDGSITYRYRNITRAPASRYIAKVSPGVASALTDLTGIALTDTTVDQVLGALNALTLAEIQDTEVNAAGQITHTSTLNVIHPDTISAVAVGDTGISPPFPVLTTHLPLTQSGTLNQNLPYTTTLTLQGTEQLETEVGVLPDCLHVQQTLNLGSTTRSETWYL